MSPRLMFQCDEEIEEKRPYIQPQDLIYAQPVHLKPVGRPIAAVPLKGGPPSSIGYGPPKPVPFPSYGGPSYSGPPLSLAPPRPYISNGKPPIGPLYGASRPPPVYEPIDTIDKKQALVRPSEGVQQHVHHHYHHTDSEKTGVIDAPGPVYPSATGGGTGSLYAGEVNSLYGNSLSGNGFVGSPTYGGGSDSYAGSSSFYKKELNLKGSASSVYSLYTVA